MKKSEKWILILVLFFLVAAGSAAYYSSQKSIAKNTSGHSISPKVTTDFYATTSIDALSRVQSIVQAHTAIPVLFPAVVPEYFATSDLPTISMYASTTAYSIGLGNSVWCNGFQENFTTCLLTYSARSGSINLSALDAPFIQVDLGGGVKGAYESVSGQGGDAGPPDELIWDYRNIVYHITSYPFDDTVNRAQEQKEDIDLAKLILQKAKALKLNKS